MPRTQRCTRVKIENSADIIKDCQGTKRGVLIFRKARIFLHRKCYPLFHLVRGIFLSVARLGTGTSYLRHQQSATKDRTARVSQLFFSVVKLVPR